MGVVTSSTLRLVRLPEAVKTMLAIFDTLENAGSAVSDIISAGIIPATLEIMDQAIVQAVETSVNRAGYPIDAGGVLLIELDGMRDGQERQAKRIAELCRKNGAREVQVARDDQERARLWTGRRSAYAAMVRLAAGVTVHDMTVPRTRLSEALRGAWDIAQRHGVVIGGAAHAGDGNLHPLVLYDPKDPDEARRAHEADTEIVELCVSLGGTITGEHGVGLEKREKMRAQFGEDDLAAMRLVKRALDPQGLLNPGKLLPEQK
jgi:FAD/FMN-containing dehydrogenase